MLITHTHTHTLNLMFIPSLHKFTNSHWCNDILKEKKKGKKININM